MAGKRAGLLFIAFLSLFILLVGRFFYLQIFDGQKLSKAASLQRISNAKIEKPRGDILDTNGIPFTDRSKKSSLVLKPLFLRDKKEEVEKIAEILGIKSIYLSRELESRREPIVMQADAEKIESVKALDVEGVSVVHSLRRYDEGTLAKHVLGYLNKIDQCGETGIEKSYENFLKYDKDNTMSVMTDAKNNLIRGIGYRVQKPEMDERKLNVKLTLDYHIQKIVEEVLDKNGIKGAVVVEDVATGNILAMSSKPDFDPYDVGRYLSSANNELFNRAVASYDLGSVFKIIDAACAFEYGKLLEGDFECTGSVMIGDKEFKCSSYEKGGNGKVDMLDAFSQSCNSYFISLGINIGSEKIINMAKSFGLGQATGIKDMGVDEASGALPEAGKRYTDGEIANMSIGQGNMMATPLQVADMVATVANGGIKNRVNIIDSIVDREGNKVKDLRYQEGTRIISRTTANSLKKLMEEVLESGTGTKANIDEYGGAGGKTGTAETGQVINGEKVVQAWFAGYFPKRDPRYSVAVFIENGRSGGQDAAPIFAEIASEIIKKGY